MSVSECRPKPRQEVAANPSKRVILFDDHPIRASALPPVDTERWTTRRKAAVIAAIRGGLITLDDAYKRYRISAEELLSWERLIDRHGMRGLRVTKLQEYRATVKASR